VRGFSQALRHEIEGTRVGITVVHPEGVATSTAKNARAPEGGSAEEIGRGHAMANKPLKLPPEVAGEIVVQGVERRKSRILVGSDAKLASVIERKAGETCPRMKKQDKVALLSPQHPLRPDANRNRHNLFMPPAVKFGCRQENLCLRIKISMTGTTRS
jgi:hypothetical protein